MLRKSLLAIAALAVMSGSAGAQGIPVNLGHHRGLWRPEATWGGVSKSMSAAW